MITIKASHEDTIYKVKEFIKELSRVGDEYLESLVEELDLTSKGEEWLFDYIYNGADCYDGFEDYCNAYGVSDDVYNTNSDTPITDSHKRKIEGYADEWVPRYVSEELERKLRESKGCKI
jgi:thiaminase